MTTLKKYMKCDHLKATASNPEDIAQALRQLMSLSSSYLFPHYQHLNECSTNNFQAQSTGTL
jgi:hypothetical protein